MKSIVSILAIAIAIAFTAPAFAGPGSTITNKEDSRKPARCGMTPVRSASRSSKFFALKMLGRRLGGLFF